MCQIKVLKVIPFEAKKMLSRIRRHFPNKIHYQFNTYSELPPHFHFSCNLISINMYSKLFNHCLVEVDILVLNDEVLTLQHSCGL